MNFKNSFILSVVLLFFVTQGKAQTYTAMWYNVENLFDTTDDPHTKDNSFLPESELQWNKKRYKKKLKDLSKTIALMPDVPFLVGLCEVENRKVVQHLVKQRGIKAHKYSIVHHDSPDHRGIDVALLYRPSQFRVISDEVLDVKMPGNKGFTTRDILYVQGVVQQDTLHVFLNHWPSRSGGKAKSDPKRALAAKRLRAKVDELQKRNPNAKILIMGDMNDEPKDESLSKILKAKHETKKAKQLHNLMWSLKKQNKGTYSYRGNWNMLDHIIVSQPTLKASKGLVCKPNSGQIFNHKALIYTSKKGKKSPSRTYVGRKHYVGGISDHFPVYVQFQYK